MTRRRGFSLAEIMVSMFLLTLLLVVTGEAVSWGLRAHRKGEASRVAASKSREILGRICTEISTGVQLAPYQPNSSMGVSSDFQSAVLWPDPYTQVSNVFGAGFYQRSQGNTTNSGGQSLGYDQVQNRVILTRPLKATGDSSYNDYDFSQFVYVEYLSAPPRPDGKGQNILYRRVYPVSVPPSTVPQGLIAQANSLEQVDPSFFSVDVADPTDNPNTTQANAAQAIRQQQMEVEQLPHDSDVLQFTVQHLVYQDPRGQLPPRAAAYNPAMFTVTVNASVDQDAANTFFGSYSLSQQITVRADAQGL